MPERPYWRRVLTFIADYCGVRWLQDDPLTAILAYLAIGTMFALLGEVIWLGMQRGAL